MDVSNHGSLQEQLYLKMGINTRPYQVGEKL